MTKKTFISVGECMAELQLAEAGRYSLGFGGDTLNTAWYLKALTFSSQVDVEYFTAVGSDPLSKDLLKFLNEHEIGTRCIREIPDRNVGLYLISLIGAERNFTYWRNASAAKLLAEDEETLRKSLLRADVVYFTGITLAILEASHRQTLIKVLNEAKSRGVSIVFDSNARRRLWPSDEAMKDAMVAGYRVATLAMPTFDDDRMLFGDANPIECANRIAAYGVHEVVVKNGADTCIVMADGELQSALPAAVEGIIDTTGAGDSFNAGYIAARIADKTRLEAAMFGHQVAGRVICSRGALLDMALFSDIRVG